MRHLGASVWRAQGVTVARVEVTTDEPRCGIDPCSPALQRNADPHPAMDRPLSKSRPLPPCVKCRSDMIGRVLVSPISAVPADLLPIAAWR
jgi:hypothetical protein